MPRWQKHLRPFTLLPAPATQPLLIVNFAQIWILTTSCQSGGSLHGNQKKVPSDPQGCPARCQPTVQHSLVPTAPKTLSLSCLTQGWILVHFHGAGVSELVWTGEHCPAKVTRIQGVLSWQPFALGESGQSASLEAKMGPAEGTQLRSASRKAHPVLRPNPQTGTDTGSYDVPTPAGSFPGRLREPELADGEDLGHLWPHLDNRTSGPPCSP